MEDLTKTISFEVFDPKSPKSWWPKEILCQPWEYEAYVNATVGIVFNAPNVHEAIAFAQRMKAYVLFGKGTKPIYSIPRNINN